MKWEINWAAMGMSSRGSSEKHYFANLGEIGRANIRSKDDGKHDASVTFWTRVAIGTFDSFDEAAAQVKAYTVRALTQALESCKTPKGGHGYDAIQKAA